MFKLKSVKSLDDMVFLFNNGEDVFIENSDISLQTDTHFLQFAHIPEEKVKETITAKTGVYNLEWNDGPELIATEIAKQNLYGENKASTEIIREFENFFQRLPLYDELDILKKRGILLYGPPGTGKSANISKAIQDLIKNGDTTVIFWSPSSIRSSDMINLLSTGISYSEDVKKLVIVIEDIGMGAENYGGAKEVDSSLLNILDGANSTIKVPTFFVATTNYAHNLPEPLLRPGRFDNWIEVSYPSPEERVALIEFISKVKLSDEDRDVILSKQLEKFSVAHLKELVIRTKRDGVSYKKVISDLNDLSKRFGKAFQSTGSGFGLL